MKRLDEKERVQVISLMKRGKSLNQISRIMNRSKSTLYYHYKKEFGKKYHDIQIDLDELFLGELIGLFAGDGYCFFDSRIYDYSIRFFFNNAEKKFVREIEKIFVKKLNKKPEVCRTKNVLIVRYHSKKLFNFILEYVGWDPNSKTKSRKNKKSRTVYLKDKGYSKKFKIGFLRGFIDSDGYISKDKLSFSSASRKIMEQTRLFLEELGFKDFRWYFYNDQRGDRVGMYHINLRKGEREKFFKLIKPRNLVKLNASAGI